MKFSVVSFLLLAVININASDTLSRFSRPYIKSYGTDAWNVYASPVKWGGRDWLTFGAVAAGTAVLFSSDHYIMEHVQHWRDNNHNQFIDGVAESGAIIGNAAFSVPPLVLVYGYGALFHSPIARRIALDGAESAALAGALTCVLKAGFHRHRPKTTDDPWDWDGPSISTHNLSFASGHSTTAFALATSIAQNCPDNPWVAALCYSIAGMVALSRIYNNQHWASDAFVGSAIGYFTATAVHNLHDAKSSKVNVSVMSVDGVPGVGLGLNF